MYNNRTVNCFLLKRHREIKTFFYENIKLCVLDGISNNVKKIFHFYYEGENTNDQCTKTYIVIVVSRQITKPSLSKLQMRYPNSINWILRRMTQQTKFVVVMLILICNIEIEIGVRFILVFTPYVLCRNEIAQISGNMVLIWQHAQKNVVERDRKYYWTINKDFFIFLSVPCYCL